MQRIRVLIVDDQTLVREGFRKLLELEPDFEVVGTAANGEAALTNASSTRPPTASTNYTPSSTSTTYIDATSYVEQLTEREREILALVAQGASNRQVAERLYLTEGTVKNHMSSILSKLGVRDRTQAVLKAKELGLT